MDGNRNRISPQQVREHPRVRRLGERAREMYLYLLEHASPDGSVVHKRIDDVMTEDTLAFYELMGSGLLNAEWYVFRPVVLDQAEVLERGEVP
jgi:hypothetical protein